MRWWERLDGPVLGRYRIERLLGEGGMARVFLATDVRADRPVAFKTPKIESFPPDSVGELIGRFNREFRSQASDPIQGVIPIYESGEFTDAEGVVRPFMAMQYLSGGSLGDLLGGQIGARTHRQTLGEVLDWLVPIARTVDRLHARKYLHRDIKPDNIMFNSDGDPFLADFGVVGSLDTALTGATLSSKTMGMMGSPGSAGYQSPESIQSDAALRNISASDQFSLAVTVYEALSGVLPVRADTIQQWYAALVNWTPIPLSVACPELPAAASATVLKAMSANASGRFASCSEFAKALAGAAVAPQPAAGVLKSVVSSPPHDGTSAALTPTSPLWPSKRSKAVIGVAVLVGVVVAVGLALARRDPTPPVDVLVKTPTGAQGAIVEPKAEEATSTQLPAPVDAGIVLPSSIAPAASVASPVAPSVVADPPAIASNCRELDGDRDNVNDCDDKCPASPAGDAISDSGCGSRDPNKRQVVFGHRSADLEPSQLAILESAASYYQANPELLVRIHGTSSPSEQRDSDFHEIAKRRAEAVQAFLLGKGIDSGRLQPSVQDSGDVRSLTNPDGSPNLMALARSRRVRLSAYSFPQKWVVCLVHGLGSDGKTLFYTVSEVMNLGADAAQDLYYFGGVKRNAPAVSSILRAAGVVNMDQAVLACSKEQATPDRARATYDRMFQEFQQAKSQFKLVNAGGTWVAKSAGTRP